MIRNCSPGSLRPSSLPLGRRGLPQYWNFTPERGRNMLFLWHLNATAQDEPAISDFPCSYTWSDLPVETHPFSSHNTDCQTQQPSPENQVKLCVKPSSRWSRLLSSLIYFISRPNHCCYEWDVCLTSRLANICAQIKQIWVFFSQLKLWVAVARHNPNWVGI